MVVKCYRLTHDEITSNVNRNQVDWLRVTLWKTDMIFPQKISTLLNTWLNNRKFYKVVEYFLHPWFNFKCMIHPWFNFKCDNQQFLFKTLSNTSTLFNPSSRWQLGSWDVKAVRNKKQKENQWKIKNFVFVLKWAWDELEESNPTPADFCARMLYH